MKEKIKLIKEWIEQINPTILTDKTKKK